MIALILATIVTPSATAGQVLALLAVLVFFICVLWAVVTRAFYSALLAFGLLLLAAAAIWGWAAAAPPG